MRLWGKIRGNSADYFIAEGSLDEGEEGGADAGDNESRGSGVNKFVYWVTNSPLGQWTQLPELTRQDIINSRSIKYTFSGNLDQKIYSNPFYFGTEKLYLRAQIARIAQSTNLVPRGLHRLQEENDREIEDNQPEEGEIVKPTTAQQASHKNWVHYVPSILTQGRTTHLDGKPVGDEEIEPQDLLAREVAKDPWEPRLKPIGADKAHLGGIPAWIIRTHGAQDAFVDERSGNVNVNYGTVHVKSTWWPGAHVFYHQERTLFIYCGNG